MRGPGVTLGVDLGGTKALASAWRGGREVWSGARPTGRGLGPAACLRLVADLVDAASREAPVDRLGIGFPGLVEPGTGRVRSSVILDGWDHVPLAAQLEERTGCSTLVDNDVNNAARAEVATRAVAGAPADDLLFVAVGTGIGGALVLRGRVWPGVAGLAGEVGHMTAGGSEVRCDCGGTGCVCLQASGRSMGDALGVSAEDLPVILAGAASAASAVLERAAVRLGAVVADAMNLLNLPLVVLGGGVAEQPGFVDLVDRAFRSSAMPEVAAVCRVEPARAGYSAGARGAVLLADEDR